MNRAAWAAAVAAMAMGLAGCNRQEAGSAPAAATAASGSSAAPAAAPAATASAAPSAAAAAPPGKLYTVVDGSKVDAKTLEGFRTWRQAACDRCHGANQEGMVGPSLIASLKTLTKDDFVKVLKEGRVEKGMPSWSTNEKVMANIDNLYAYLKGRSDGAITQAHVTGIDQ